jgi:hypothetical protein
MNVNLWIQPPKDVHRYKTRLSSQGFNKTEAELLEFLVDGPQKYRLFG